MDFNPDYIYYIYPNDAPMDVCQVQATKQNHYCGSVFVKGTVYVSNPTITVNTLLHSDSLNSDCGCCNDRVHRILGNLVVSGQIVVGNTVIINNVSLASAPCCPVQTEHVCGDLLLTNNLIVSGTIVTL